MITVHIQDNGGASYVVTSTGKCERRSHSVLPVEDRFAPHVVDALIALAVRPCRCEFVGRVAPTTDYDLQDALARWASKYRGARYG